MFNMPKYIIYNPGPNWAVELKPGIGEFRIPPDGSIEVDSKEIAESLIRDSDHHLTLEYIE